MADSLALKQPCRRQQDPQDPKSLPVSHEMRRLSKLQSSGSNEALLIPPNPVPLSRHIAYLLSTWFQQKGVSPDPARKHSSYNSCPMDGSGAVHGARTGDYASVADDLLPGVL